MNPNYPVYPYLDLTKRVETQPIISTATPRAATRSGVADESPAALAVLEVWQRNHKHGL